MVIKMTKDGNTAWLIGLIEREIASYRYYRPYNQWKRYPVRMTENGGDDYYEREDTLTQNYADAASAYYKFGRNELYIGQGIEKALEMMENRYGLDFAQLEADYTDRTFGHDEDDDNY